MIIAIMQSCNNYAMWSERNLDVFFEPGWEYLAGDQVENRVDAKGVRDEHQDGDEQGKQSKDTMDLDRKFGRRVCLGRL